MSTYKTARDYHRLRLLGAAAACGAVLGLSGCAGVFHGGGTIDSDSDGKATFSFNAEAIDCKDDGDLFIDEIKGRATYNDHKNRVAFKCDFSEPNFDGAVPAWVFHNFRSAVFIGSVSHYRGNNGIVNGDACVFLVSDFSEPGNAVSPDRITVTVCDGAATGAVEAFLGNPCANGTSYTNGGELQGGNIQYGLSHAPRGLDEATCEPIDFDGLTAEIEARLTE